MLWESENEEILADAAFHPIILAMCSSFYPHTLVLNLDLWSLVYLYLILFLCQRRKSLRQYKLQIILIFFHHPNCYPIPYYC